MTNTEILLGLLSVLTYFAGVQRGKRYRAEDRARHEAERHETRQREIEAEKALRVREVVDRYRSLANSLESSSLRGMLKAGVLSLHSGDEVREACRLISDEGLPPAVPPVYMAQLEGLDLLAFFQLIRARREQAGYHDGVKRIIQELREGAGA